MSKTVSGSVGAWDEHEARTIIARLSRLEGAMLPILHELQGHFGFVPPEAVPLIADQLNLSRAEVHGVISFYHDFHTAPPPARIVKLCRAEACQAQGCEDLLQALSRDHSVVPDQATAELLVETVYCLGNCALGPSALVGDELVGRLSADRLAALCGLVEVVA